MNSLMSLRKLKEEFMPSDTKKSVKLVFDDLVDLKDIPDVVTISDPRIARALLVLLLAKSSEHLPQER